MLFVNNEILSKAELRLRYLVMSEIASTLFQKLCCNRAFQRRLCLKQVSSVNMLGVDRGAAGSPIALKICLGRWRPLYSCEV